MRKILKKAGVIILSASIITQIAGCASDTAQKAEKALEEKYNKQFEVVKVGKFTSGDTYNLVCKQGDIKFTAEVNGDCSYMYDNYNASLLEKDLIAEMSEQLDEVAGDFVIGMEIFGGVDNYTEGNPSVAISSNPQMEFDIRIAINSDKELSTETDKIYTALKNVFAVENINGSARIGFVNNEDMKKVRKILDDNPDVDSTVNYAMDNGVVFITHIRNGQIDLTSTEIEDNLH